MKTTFDTRKWETSHGRGPQGHGPWLLEDRATGLTFEHTGTLTEARKAAKRAHPQVASWVVLP